MEENLAQRETAWLAPYAMHSVDSAGRKHAEPSHAYRGPYPRDRDRILHSAATRRLSHKTQVFTGEMGDYHRTRLTHTLEVASIARTLARALRLNEDLVEALALANDIGHPPNGHAGEDTLDELLRDATQRNDRFNHNAQALRILERLESRYPNFPGLNLTFEVLEGQSNRAHKKQGKPTNPGSPEGSSPLLEVQIVDVADSIAYDAHDADDSLEIGLLKLEQLLEVPLWHEAAQRVRRRFANLDTRQLRRAVVHELIDWQVGDVLHVVETGLSEGEIASVADVRLSDTLVQSSPALAEQKVELEAFLFQHVYRHPTILGKRQEAQEALRAMFAFYCEDPERLPEKFRELANQEGIPRAVTDYLAGMTDHYALEQSGNILAAGGGRG